MKLEKIDEKENKIFDRKEVILEGEGDVTPSYEDLSQSISEQYSVDKLAVKIIKVHTKFGTNKFRVEANVYPSKEDKEKIELKTKKDKAIEEAMAKKAEEEAKPEEPKESEEESSGENNTTEEKTEESPTDKKEGSESQEENKQEKTE